VSDLHVWHGADSMKCMVKFSSREFWSDMGRVLWNVLSRLHVCGRQSSKIWLFHT
jgi:hypothetical protein